MTPFRTLVEPVSGRLRARLEHPAGSSGRGGQQGFSLVELVIVMACLGTVLAGLTSLFTAGLNADSDQNRRFQAQQDARVSVDRLSREAHAACAIAAPATYNSAVSSVTFYFPVGSTCASGTNSVTWCTVASGSKWTLDRVVATSCSGSMQIYASNVTKSAVFTYLPPNSHLVTAGSLGLGTSSSYIVTQDGSSSLPRLYVDVPVNLKSTHAGDLFELNDVIALRNGPRACASGTASC